MKSEEYRLVAVGMTLTTLMLTLGMIFLHMQYRETLIRLGKAESYIYALTGKTGREFQKCMRRCRCHEDFLKRGAKR